MRKILLMVILFTSMISFSQAQNSYTSDYWFEGYIYKNNTEGQPFLTVVLHEMGNDIPRAVTMSSNIGYINFNGIPIDIYKDHILSVYIGKRLLGRYLREGFQQQPKFKGNLNVHIQMSDCPNEIEQISYYPSEEDKSIFIRDFLLMKGMDIDGASIFPKGSETPLRLFLNGLPIGQNKMEILLDKIPMEVVEQIIVYEYNAHNDYYSGAISIQLIQGKKAEFPTDIPLYSLITL